MILEWRETTVHYTYYNSLLAGLSQQENKERIIIEKDLCRLPTRSSMQPPTTFVAENDWFSELVSVIVECACPVETPCWIFLSPQLLLWKLVL